MKIKFYESSKVKCQVVDTAYGGFGIKAHIMDQEERDKIVQSKKDWVKIGVYAVEKKYPHPIDTPLFKDRMIGDIKGSVLSGTRAGDVGENLAVFANHTSFIPNAIMHGHNNNQEHWLMVLKQAVLDGEEIKWSYAQDNPDHHDYHGLEAHYEPNQDDIETVENYSIWERLKSILHGSKPWCQLTHNYVCTVFKNLLQNTPLQFYIEYGMKNKKSQELAKDIIKRIHDNVKRLYPPREGYHVARLKDHPEFINWIRACNWDTMI